MNTATWLKRPSSSSGPAPLQTALRWVRGLVEAFRVKGYWTKVAMMPQTVAIAISLHPTRRRELDA